MVNDETGYIFIIIKVYGEIENEENTISFRWFIYAA
jgi:hypothetical protein